MNAKHHRRPGIKFGSFISACSDSEPGFCNADKITCLVHTVFGIIIKAVIDVAIEVIMSHSRPVAPDAVVRPTALLSVNNRSHFIKIKCVQLRDGTVIQ